MDYVDGMRWVECGDDLPLCVRKYSTFHASVFASFPCKAVTAEHRIIRAVYVIAESVVPCNYGSHTRWEGWAEMSGEADGYSCVAKVLNGESVDVLRWHYPKGLQIPSQRSYEKMLQMEIYMDSAAAFADSRPKEWLLVREDGTVIATGPAEIAGSVTRQQKVIVIHETD